MRCNARAEINSSLYNRDLKKIHKSGGAKTKREEKYNTPALRGEIYIHSPARVAEQKKVGRPERKRGKFVGSSAPFPAVKNLFTNTSSIFPRLFSQT